MSSNALAHPAPWRSIFPPPAPGFLYAMKISKRLISDGAFNNALIIGAEKLSSVTNWEDRSTCVLFGDGAGAAVLRRAEPGEGAIVATEMGTDGNLTHLLEIPGGGTRLPDHRGQRQRSPPHPQHAGQGGLQDRRQPHEGSRRKGHRTRRLAPRGHRLRHPAPGQPRIIDAIADRLAVPNERVFVNLDKYGNTSAAAVAIALDEANRTGAFKRGDHIVLVVFGAGLTWAAAAIRW